MTLRGKLLLALSPLALAVGVLGAVSLWSVGRLGGRSQAILQDNYRSVLAAERMKEALERLDSAALFRLAGRPDETAPLVAPNRERFEAELRVQEGNLTEPDEPAATRRLRVAWDRYRGRYEAFLAEPDPARARRAYFEGLQPDFQEIKAAADEVLGLNQDAMVRKSARAGRFAEEMSGLSMGATLAALLIGLLLSGAWTARLLRPLGVLAQAVRRLGEGDLEARAAVAGSDEISALAREFNTMAAHLQQYRRSSLGELLQAQQASQAAIDSLPDPVIVFGTGGAIVNVNRAAEDLLGLGLEGEGAEPLARLDPALRELLGRVRAHVLGGKGPYQPRGFEEAVTIVGAGAELSLLARATPVYDEQGSITGATVVLQDVTRLRRFDELKNDLVATVAHEFRTPLTSLHMAIHLCLEELAGPLTEKQADLLHAARQDCERLQGIVDELLDLARIQSGHIALDLRPVDCEALCDAAVDAHRAAAEERGVALRAQVLPGLPTVLVDRERLHLVLSNLIVNALRHTPAGGGVTLRAEAAGPRVRLSVTDTGEGIAKEHQGRIFERFYRVPGAAGGGAGLGLALSKEIVSAHGGEIGVESEPGRGATFWLTLPAAATPRGRAL